jgi:hypothetical protein
MPALNTLLLKGPSQDLVKLQAIAFALSLLTAVVSVAVANSGHASVCLGLTGEFSLDACDCFCF